MNKVYISLGANLGNRIQTIEKAYEQISESCGRIVARSSFYSTPPWGFQSDKDFINSVIEIETELDVMDLLTQLKLIESNAGRIPRKKEDDYEDRLIDLDIIDYDQRVLLSEYLTLPHDKMHLRNFVLIPLCEIAPNWMHPISCKSISYFLRNLEGKQGIKQIPN